MSLLIVRVLSFVVRCYDYWPLGFVIAAMYNELVLHIIYIQQSFRAHYYGFSRESARR